MHLDVGGERLAVNQLGPDFALVESTVDEALTVRPVFLPEGIQSGVVRIRLALS